MTHQDGTPTVGLLGTGIMGNGMARSIARAGLPLRVWNRTLSKATPLESEGALVAATPADAVKGADVIVTMLADGPAVLDAMTAAADGLRSGQIWTQTSTVGPQALESLTGFAQQHGLTFIDSPVQGTRQPAESGQLLVYAAGPDAPGQERESARSRVQPVFDAIGRKTVWLPHVGDAARLKLVANSWVLALTVATGETIAFAQRLGVDPQQFLDAVAGGATDSPYMRTKAAAILSDDYTPSFPLNLAAKDARLIIEAGEAAGAHMDVTRAAAERFRRAAARGHDRDDMAAAYFASFDGG
jgi:3-hydroxyisobutyrate dehydrogenase